MRVLLLLMAAFCFGTPCAFAQDNGQAPGGDDSSKIVQRSADEKQPAVMNVDAPTLNSTIKIATASSSDPIPNPPEVLPSGSAKIKNLRPIDYRRPDAGRRLNNYLREIAGPTAIFNYAATATLLTWRNTPKEWGTKPDGFAKRFGNVAAKNVIRASTTYALDEALKVDSTFYLSRDRSPAARLRNSVFSAVTARNRQGKRVIGIPRLAGGFLSEVVSSVAWYPARYDQDHGLKGGAISVGINAGVNIFREFILKR